MCESAGALAYKFLCQLMVRKREQISEETVTKLKAIPENRCGTCGDLLRRYEKHHKKPFCKGGTDDLDNLVLLCPQCHAQETEKQEQANCGTSSVFLESRFSPRMYNLFAELPIPRQLHWGDMEQQARAREQGCSYVRCLDVVGCRSNFCLERKRDLPIGCPLDA